MTKKIHIDFLCLVSILTYGFSTYGSDRITVGGIELNTDTIRHSTIGPATTLTQLHLSGEQPMDVHYITIDLTDSRITLRTTNADTANGLKKTSEMAKSASSDNTLFFAGINGDFFDVQSTYPDGSLRPRMTANTYISDGHIIKTSPGGFQFILNEDGSPYIDNLKLERGTVSHGNSSIRLGGVNVENINYSGDAAPDNAVTIYTSRGWKSTYQTQFAGTCAEVSAKIVDGDKFEAGATCRLEVTSSATSTGNLAVPKDGFVLLGRGEGKDFIESLVPGDIVTVCNRISLTDGTTVTPLIAVGGNPRCVIGGIAQESDGTRPDAVELHPRTGIGIDKNGSKVIMMVIDGRGESKGATTRQLGDLLVYAGAHEGLNFDGGGSSTCYTEPFGVVNACSDASGERTVCNALFAVANGDIHSREIKEIRFADWKATVPRNGVYTPVIHAYNEAGVLIDSHFENYTLSCDPELGIISKDGKSLTLTSSKGGKLFAEFNGQSASVTVFTLPSEIKPRLQSVLIDGIQPYGIELFASSGNMSVPADASAFEWYSENPDVATVDETGTIIGKQNGTTVITGNLDDREININITVEIATSAELQLHENGSDWSITTSSVKVKERNDSKEGITVSYTTASTVTKANLTFTNRQTLYSRPDGLKISYASDIAMKEMSVMVTPANAKTALIIENTEPIGESGTWNIAFDKYLDTDDAAIWPVKLVSFSLKPGEAGNSSGKISITEIKATYRASCSVNEISIENHSSDEVVTDEWYTLTGIRIQRSYLSPGIYIRRRGNHTDKIIIR